MLPDLVILRHEDWLRCQRLFSVDAVVRTLDLDMAAVPMVLDDVPVLQFQWPVPAGIYRAGIFEPDRPWFDTALERAGIKLPKAMDLPGADLVPTKEITAEPGSLTPNSCPNCDNELLRFSDIETALKLIGLYNFRRQGTFRWEPCDEHGIHAYVNGKSIFALECISCCEHYLIGEATDSQMLPIREES